MEMKEVIIDGVDVAGCCCYENGKCLWTKRYYKNNIVPDCEKVKDCYYKQFKRIEKENNNLREAMHKDFCSHYILGECSQDHHNNCVGRNQCIKDLEQENETLKANYHILETQANNIITVYKQTLDAIKEIVEECNKEIFCPDCKLYDKCKYLPHGRGFANEILQKISEVRE